MDVTVVGSVRLCHWVHPDVSTHRSAFTVRDRKATASLPSLRKVWTTYATTQRHTKTLPRGALLSAHPVPQHLSHSTHTHTHTSSAVMKRPCIPAPKRRPQHETDSSHIRELSAFCVTFCTSTVRAENICTTCHVPYN